MISDVFRESSGSKKNKTKQNKTKREREREKQNLQLSIVRRLEEENEATGGDASISFA